MSKRFFSVLIIIVMIMIIVPAFVFGAGESEEAAGVTTLEFWIGTDEKRERFWKEVINDFNSTHDNIQIDCRTMPTGGSSEEILLTSLATGTEPDLCTGIFSGFLSQLAENDAVVALNKEFPDFWSLAREASVESLLKKGWEIKGKYCVVPMYCNPIHDWYNKDLLAKAGLTEPPRTYSEFIAAARKVCVPGEIFAADINYKSNWWSRWWDLLNSYYAATGGKSYIDVETGRLAFDDKYGRAYLNHIAGLFAEKLCEPVDIRDGVLHGTMFMKHPMGGDSYKGAVERFPDKPFVVAQTLVPDFVPASQKVYGLADSKGIVIFKSCENKEAAWEFMKWYFSDVKHSMGWLEATGVLPARDDLLENPVFSGYFEGNPDLKMYAEKVAYSLPPVVIPNTVEVHELINYELWEPIIFGRKTVDEALADVIPKVQALWD